MNVVNSFFKRLAGWRQSPHWSVMGVALWNVGGVFVLFMVGRIAFFCTNEHLFPSFWENRLGLLLQGALQFDLSGILYFLLLYLVLHFLPLPFSWSVSKGYRLVEKVSWIVMSGIALMLNFFDTMYFPFSQRRATASVFAEFDKTDNLWSVLFASMSEHWLLSLISIGMVVSLFFLYRPLSLDRESLRGGRKVSLLCIRGVFFILVIGLCVVGIRGGVSRTVRPITLSNANQYVLRPTEASVLLNTPFTLVRTFENKQYPEFRFFADDSLADFYFPSETSGVTEGAFRPLNVVVLVMESFGREYIGALNRDIQGGDYKGYTPFLDSLISQSVTFRTSLSNGHKSIDALPSVLASIPSFVEPYFVGDFGNNKVMSLAGSLKEKGYYSAFFHGAPNGSMGFWAFAKASGFEHEYGMSEYNNDRDFDGTWAIWDEPFMGYFARQLNDFREPFVACLFSASSHHPFRIPKEYEGVLEEGRLPIQKCIRYSDIALRGFFEKARRSDWFDRTIFVITGDHTNQSELAEYQSSVGSSSVPIIFYAPKLLKPEYRDEVAQQIDIKPSVLGLLNYDRNQIHFGRNLFAKPLIAPFAVNEAGGYYQYFSNEHVLQFDGSKSVGLYEYRTDRLLKNNLIDEMRPQADSLERHLKAALQVYMRRMRNNQLQ